MAKRPSLIVELTTLRRAAIAMYYAPEPVDKKTREALRDALGLPPNATAPPTGVVSAREILA